MNATWREGILGDFVSEFIVPQRDKPKSFSGSIPWCRIEDIDGIWLSKSKSGKCVTESVIRDMPLRVFPTGTVIVSCSADLGRCAIVSRPLVTNQTFIGLVPKSTLDARFLYYLMTNRANELNAIATGATIKYLSQDKFRGLAVSIPPLPEQQRIVSILDEAFEGIAKARANAEKNLANAKSVRKSFSNFVFRPKSDWTTTTLSDVCEMYQPKTIGTRDLISDGKYSVFGANGVIGKYDKYNHEDPQLLITCRGATCGAVNISYPKSWITGNAMVVRPKDGRLHLKFLEFFFRGGADLSKAITGAAQPQITRSNLSPLKISFPTYEKQVKLADVLNSLFLASTDLEYVIKKKISAIEELRSSILDSAFSAGR